VKEEPVEKKAKVEPEVLLNDVKKEEEERKFLERVDLSIYCRLYYKSIHL